MLKGLYYRKSILFIVDITLIFLAAILAFHIRFGIPLEFFFQMSPTGRQYAVTIFIVTTLWLLIFNSFGLYSCNLSRSGEIYQIIKAIGIGSALILMISFFYRGYSYSRGVAILFITLSFVIIPTGRRIIMDKILTKLINRGGFVQRVLIIGAGEVGKALLNEVEIRSLPYNIVGFLDDKVTTGEKIENHKALKVIGRVHDLSQIITNLPIDKVFIAMPSAPHEKILEIIELCTSLDISWKAVPDLYDLLLRDVSLDRIGNIPLVSSKSTNINGFNFLIKRVLDIVLSSGLLLIFSPLILLVSFIIKLTSDGPIIYRQERVGYKNKPFTIFKFRSMYINCNNDIHQEYTKNLILNGDKLKKATNGKEKQVFKIKDDPRITPIGRIIRKFSIDELPQLFNVLRGDMSLIGPRPALDYEVRNYKNWHLKRLNTLPGITGLWQVSGRNRLTFDEMVNLDIRYIENWSLGLDLQIVFKTIFVVLFGEAW